MAAIGVAALNGEWIPAENGHIPSNAFPGGDNDGEPIFVARGYVGGSLATGSLIASQGCCYIAWGGEAHPLQKYEVLCNFNGKWIDWTGSQMPRNGYIAGKSEANEELMYVGRAVVDGILKVELSTPDKLEYQYLPNNSGFLQFRVRASQDAHVALTTGASTSNPMYEILFGSWNNTKTVIRKNQSKPDVAEVLTPSILNGGEYRGFWVRWQNGIISAGTEGNFEPIAQFADTEVIPIEYIGVCTGWGATGTWIIEPPRAAPSAPTSYPSGPGGYPGGNAGGYPGGGYPGGNTGGYPGGNAGGYPGGGTFSSVCWVPASSGQMPPNAFIGGEDNGEPMAVIRARFNDAFLPGKLISSHGTCYVPWGGNENAVNDYEVLCDFRGDWVQCQGGNIPPNALTGGQTEDGEPLYVGRVMHQGTMTVGKVQQSHGVCYIPYGGQELAFPEYQILVKNF